jgi:hypothetical protein
MAVTLPTPDEEPDLEALRAFARALIGIATDIRKERDKADPETYPKRVKLRKEVGPHRVNGRPRDPNPVLEGRDMKRIPGNTAEDRR